MIEEVYLQNLRCYSPDPADKYRTFQRKLWINQEHTNVILEDVVKTSFKSMYSYMMLQFHRYGLINIGSQAKEIELFFDDYDLNYQNPVKRHWINTRYVQFLGKKESNLIYGLIEKYQFLLYDYLSINNSNLVHIDCDQIFSIGDIDVSYFHIPYKVKKIKFSYFSNIKEYSIYDESLTPSFKSFGGESEMTEKFKSLIREHRIKNII